MEVSPCSPLRVSHSLFFVLLRVANVVAFFCDYIDPAAATILFVQSNHVYASGDPPAFQARFPAPVTAVTLTFLPIV